MVSDGGLINKVIGVVLFVSILAAGVPVILASIANLSGSGIGLVALISTSFIGLLLGAFAVTRIIKMLR